MEQNYRGMTVNERLYVAGLMDAFDRAVCEKDRVEVVRILQAVDLGEADIAAILVSLGLA
jgi:hypothetical protein